jgi:hypothetical protein
MAINVDDGLTLKVQAARHGLRVLLLLHPARVDQNEPMMDVGAIKVTQKPTDYFPRPEFASIVEATYVYRGSRWGENDARFGERLRALTLLMRWSGLAIRDAVTLRRDRLGADDV